MNRRGFLGSAGAAVAGLLGWRPKAKGATLTYRGLPLGAVVRLQIDTPAKQLDEQGNVYQRIRVFVEYPRSFKGDRVAHSSQFVLGPAPGFLRVSESIDADLYARTVERITIDRYQS